MIQISKRHELGDDDDRGTHRQLLALVLVPFLSIVLLPCMLAVLSKDYYDNRIKPELSRYGLYSYPAALAVVCSVIAIFVLSAVLLALMY